MGYGLVAAALVVTAGRIGDMYGRVRMFKVGFVIFTVAAVALSLVWGMARRERSRSSSFAWSRRSAAR